MAWTDAERDAEVERILAMSDAEIMAEGEWIDCWQCYGEGMLAGCFEDTCCGADCDPEDPAFCCAPSRCDVCRGKGGRHANGLQGGPA